MESQICKRCHKLKALECFKVTDGGKRCSGCISCNSAAKVFNNRHKCEHGRQKSRCKECGGESICPHDKQKRYCKICSDPIKVTIRGWIHNARQKDKKYNRFDPNNFIDSDFCRGLIEDYSRCFYLDCEVQMQFLEHKDDLGTIERLNNKVGHIKSNCVLCCLKCNNAKKSDNLEIEYSHHHYKTS